MYPSKFVEMLADTLGEESARSVILHLGDEPSTSIRLNPFKVSKDFILDHFNDICDGDVEWASEGTYLSKRPSFTLDPVFHAGGYYVQEASSMYIGHLVDVASDFISTGSARALDLCAAPGGKSTHLLSKFSGESIIVTNEVIRSRATILAENISKWGCPNAVVTNCDPADFTALQGYFDIVLIDAPCSGEGMFRKDDNACAEWSEENVRLCAARQRRIVSDIWHTVREGGAVIYSTCTFNKYEDEDNVEWICNELGAELMEMRHFLPGRERGEGFFCALMKKTSPEGRSKMVKSKLKRIKTNAESIVKPGYLFARKGDLLKAYPESIADEIAFLEEKLKVIHSAIAAATVKGNDIIPEADLALSHIIDPGAFPEVELCRDDALRFLAKEVLSFQKEPKGHLLVKYKGLPLGFVKNLGNRANNLHPAARRIRQSIDV